MLKNRLEILYVIADILFFYQMGDPIQLKDDGNKFFQAGDIDKAIQCYTEAIKVCKDKKVLAVIHRNRSACYLKKVSSLIKHKNKYTPNILYLQFLVANLDDVYVFHTGKLCQCSF